MAQLAFACADAMGAAMSSEADQAFATDVADLGVTPTLLNGTTET